MNDKMKTPTASTVGTMLTGLSHQTSQPYGTQYTTNLRKCKFGTNVESSLLLLELAAEARQKWSRCVLATLHASNDAEARRHLRRAQQHRRVLKALVGVLVGGEGDE